MRSTSNEECWSICPAGRATAGNYADIGIVATMPDSGLCRMPAANAGGTQRCHAPVRHSSIRVFVGYSPLRKAMS